MPRQLITLHQKAPDKPLYGAKCNGCGICCAAAPCQLPIYYCGNLGGLAEP